MQVKSAWARIGRSRGYNVGRSNNKPFDTSGFDFLIVALPEQDAWYVIPADAVRGKKRIRLHPAQPKTRKTAENYEPYREAWHLLTGDEPGAWARYQRFTIHAGTE